MKESLPEASEQLPEIPRLAYRVLKNAEEGKLRLNWHSEELSALRRDMKLEQRRTRQSIGGSALIVSAAVLAGLGSSLVSAGALALLSSGLGLLGIGLLGSSLLRR